MHPQSTTPLAPTAVPPEIRAQLGSSLPPVPCKPLVVPVLGAFCYARMSKRKQANIHRQWRLEEEFATRLGVPLYDRSSDEKSGLRRDRAGLQYMLERARAREFSHLILYKYDRLSREDVDFLRIVYELFDLGIRVYDTYVGEITVANAAVCAAKAKDEIVNASQRFMAALKDLAGGGMKIGAPLVGYMKGDEPGRYVEDTVGAKYKKPSGPVVREFFKRYAADEPLYQLTRWFNQELGLKKTQADMKRLLKNPYYRGLNINCRMQKSAVFGCKPRDESYVECNYHPHGLVDEETWPLVEARLQRDARVGQHRARGPRHPLSGLVHCTRCDRRMEFHSKPSGKVECRCRVCYASRHEAKLTAILACDLERLVFERDELAVMVRERLTEQRQAAERELADVQARIARLTRLRKGYQEMRALGDITRDEYLTRMRESDREWEKLQAQREAIERRLAERGDTPAELDELRRLVAAYHTARERSQHPAAEEVRALYLRCLRAIRFDPDAAKVTVEWSPAAMLFIGTPETWWDCPAGPHAMPTPRDEERRGALVLGVGR